MGPLGYNKGLNMYTAHMANDANCICPTVSLIDAPAEELKTNVVLKAKKLLQFLWQALEIIQQKN